MLKTIKFSFLYKKITYVNAQLKLQQVDLLAQVRHVTGHGRIFEKDAQTALQGMQSLSRL